MTNEELDRLAALIADALDREHGASRGAVAEPNDGRWLPIPVRPEPPARGGDPPPWAGAAQSLSDVAPSARRESPRHRIDGGELAAATRAAAAGKAPARSRAPAGREPAARRRALALPIAVKLGVSNRHLHLSPEHLKTLIGPGGLTSRRALLQPGQFAANETVTVVGPKGRIDAVRIVGPARGETQLELAASDAALIGVEPPLAASGSLDRSIGGVTLIGPHGRVELARGVIIAARHLHLAPNDAARWGVADGDRLDVRCGTGARTTTFHDVLVRSGASHATELHLDADESRAAGVTSGADVTILAWRPAGEKRRRLVAERDVVAIARAKGTIPADALLTPSARDRARSLGLLE